MSPIKETVLFKSLLSLVPDAQQAGTADRVALALANAAAHSNVDWDNPDPNAALTWSMTPQGINYWEALSNKYDRQQRELRRAANI